MTARPKDVQNIVDAWYDMMAYWREHPDEAVSIMAKRTNSKADAYKKFIAGTRLFNAAEAQAALTQSSKPTSLFNSGKDAAQFLLDQKQIPKLPDYASAIDPIFRQRRGGAGRGQAAALRLHAKVRPDALTAEGSR